MSNKVDKVDIFNIVIYHKGCPDGSAGAWIYNLIIEKFICDKVCKTGALKNDESAEFIPMVAGKYPKELLNVPDKNVLMIDVCPSRNEIETISKTAKKLVILDHHESNEREVEGLMLPNVEIIFDMKRSGCQIAWDYFKDYLVKHFNSFTLCLESLPAIKSERPELLEKNRPWFIDAIGDRDLWKFEYPNSDEICSYLFTYGYYYNWDKMNRLLDFTSEMKNDVIKKGKTLLFAESQRVEYAVKQAVDVKITILDKEYNVKLSGCEHSIASKVGNELSKIDGYDFAALWRYNLESDEFWISCRASKDDINLSILTKEFGGGGHSKAAGFTIKNKENALYTVFKRK
jgi:nanoRNase/pAp phosphatase (c-di-AMP/oligoRNAs hydrolase)